MANRGVEDFNEVFNEGQYSSPQSGREHEGQHIHMAPHTSTSMPVENYAYPLQNAILAYDSTTDPSILPMALGPGGAFAYDTSIYPSTSTMTGSHDLDQLTYLQSQASRQDLGPTYPTVQPQDRASNMYWGQSHTTDSITPSIQGMHPHQPTFTRPAEPPADLAFQRGQSRRIPQASDPRPSHRYIQPKSSLPGKDSAFADAKPEATGESTRFSNIYSSSGFDMMGILAQLVSRPDPKINIGPVDLSCAFVLCDINLEDSPIVYVSHAFERLTGYTEREIIGRNCRFLQSPDGEVEQGEPRKFVDSQTAFRLRSTVEQRAEIQVSIINYRKGGQPFMNLVTLIPVRWNCKDFRYFVGFQVDLVEKPDAVKKRNPDGTYMIDYQRSQLPSYVAPSPDMYNDNPDPATQFSPGQVAAILDSLDGNGPTSRGQLHHILVENTDDVILVLSFEGEFLYLSPSCRTVLEYKSNDLLGKMLSTICHPSDIGPVTRDLRAPTSSNPISMIYRVRRKHSGYAWFENRGGWHISEQGRQFMVLIGRIIPVYSLSQPSKILRDCLAENDVWAKLSLSGIILFMSSKSRAVLGRSGDDFIGKSIQDVILGDNSRQEPGIQQALETSRNGQQTTISHKIRHRKGHIIPVKTTLYPGDTDENTTDSQKPTFLVAQLRFPKPPPPPLPSRDDQGQSSNDTPLETKTTVGITNTHHHPYPHPFSSTITTISPAETEPSTPVFAELNPTRGSSWQFELRELEKQNRALADEVQHLLARRKKRKRKQTAVVVEKMEKTCAMCHSKTTPEWRRGPSGNRDLCNSCGLRWAKQVRSAAQAQTEKP